MAKTAITYYIEMRIATTKCLQLHFKQLCSRCPEYPKCRTYEKYCEAWQQLQLADKFEDKDNENVQCMS